MNKIILVTHIGLDKDKEVAAGVSGVDVIVGGHSHSLLGNAYVASVAEYPVVVNDADGSPVYIVQAGEYDTYLGRLDVTFDADGVVQSAAGDTILLSNYITPDPQIEAILVALSAPIETLKQTAVGETSVFLVGDRNICRHEECNLGDLLTDALRDETGAQIAITNGGGLRSNVPVADTPDSIALDAAVHGHARRRADGAAVRQSGQHLPTEGIGRGRCAGKRCFAGRKWRGSLPAGFRHSL